MHFKVSSWSGSIEIGVTSVHPETELPACATKMSNGTWVKIIKKKPNKLRRLT